MWERFKLEWDFMTETERTQCVAAIVCGVVIVILGVLSFFGIWPGAINIYMPLLGVLLALIGRYLWDKNRQGAWGCYGAAIVVFVCACIIWVSAFLKG